MRILLRDLTPGTQYAIQLRSNTGGEVSEWSRIFYLTTESDTIPPAKPTNVVGAMSGTSFNLSWDAVTLSTDGNPASDLDHYEVFVQSSGGAQTSVYVVSDTKFEFTLEMNRALYGTPKANIQMAVSAVDKAGNSSGYTTFVSQTNPAPAAITGFTGSSTVDGFSFKWNASAESDFKEYRVYSGTSAGTQTTLVWSGIATAVVVPSIQYATDMWFKVVAVDVFDTESATAPVVGPLRPTQPFAVDTTAPGVPVGLAATLANSSNEAYATATVTWTALADPDNDLAEYIVGYRPVGATDWQYQKVDYTNTSAVINGLLPYTNYEFRIRASDYSANLSAWSTTVTATASSNTAPSTPSAPTASSGTMRIQVSHSNTKAAGGAMEGDVVFYEVYASTTTGFTPASANMLGTMAVGPAIVGSWQIPASGGGATQTWYVKVIAVDRGGLKSAASAQATATPGLIVDANIVNATITSAKIASLEANKITAGSGIINDIIVKSKLTLGDASTVGAIESHGYVAGTSGFRFDKNLLEINQGAVKAAALQIQNSTNMIPPEYASFDANPDWYNVGGGIANLSGDTIMTDGGKFGANYLRVTLDTVGQQKYPYFSPGTTTYNIPLEPGETYIASAWVRSSAQADTVSIRCRYSDTTYASFSSTTISGGAEWTRVYSVFTVPATITSGLIMMRFDATVAGQTFDVDGVQLERKMAGLDTPSPWNPPGLTKIDGSIIRTGEIRSTGNVTVNGVSQPKFSINVEGNAQFGDALIRGKLLVGQAGADADAGQSYIASGNYVANTTGWKIDSAGNAEINTGLIRGNAVINGTLSATKLATGELQAGVRIIAGASTGSHAEMTDTGFYAYTYDTDSGLTREAIRMGTATNDMFAITDAAGDTIASISETGLLSANGATFAKTAEDAVGRPYGVEIYGTDFTDWDRTHGMVVTAGSSTNANASGLTSRLGFREISFFAETGRSYTVHLEFPQVNCTTTGALGAVTLRGTTDGTSPTTTSPIYASSVVQMHTDATRYVTPAPIAITGSFGSDQLIRLIACFEPYAPSNGSWSVNTFTGNNTLQRHLRMWVTDDGWVQENTMIANTGGGGVTAVKTYVSTWNASLSASYTATNSTHFYSPQLVQGYYSSQNGDSYGYAVFGGTAVIGEVGKSIATALSGATLQKAEVYLYANHWYYNSGGTALIRPYNSTTISAVAPTGTLTTVSGWPKPGGKWVTISGATTAIRGISVGKAGSTNLLYYGRFNAYNASSGKPQLRLTYTR